MEPNEIRLNSRFSLPIKYVLESTFSGYYSYLPNEHSFAPALLCRVDSNWTGYFQIVPPVSPMYPCLVTWVKFASFYFMNFVKWPFSYLLCSSNYT